MIIKSFEKMEKSVILFIDPKKKCIKYTLQDNLSEVEIIRQEFFNLCQKDHFLEMMAKEKLAIFQRKDPDFDEWIDIEENDVIDNKSMIKVVFAPISLDTTVPCKHENFNPDTLKNGQTVELNLNVLYSEPDKVSTNENLEIQEDIECEVDNKIENNEKNKLDALAIPGCSGLQTKMSQKLQRHQLKMKKCCIPYPASLPPLTFDLQKLLSEKGIEKSQHHFIRFWGQYLWQETCGNPQKQDYHNLSSAIISSYPVLAGGANNIGIVRYQLSVWIRNHRKNYKGMMGNNEEKPKVSTASKASIVTDDTLMVNDTDVRMALTELNKKFVPGKNTSHLQRLLLITKSIRRPWIENQASRITDVIQQYSPLEDYEMILYEGIHVVLNMTKEEVFDRVSSFIDELQKYYSIEEDANVEEGSNERMKAEILTKLCRDLTVRQFKKKVPYLCEVKPVLTSAEVLLTNEGDAPRLVIFTNEDNITEAFIVADQNIRVTIPNPDTCKSISGLLAAYYAWHREFPSAYQATLEFITHKVFETPLKNNSTVAKYKRKVENCLNKLKNEG